LAPTNKIAYEMYSLLLLPRNELANHNFDNYMKNLHGLISNSDLKQVLMSFTKKVCLDDGNINQHWKLVLTGINWFIEKNPSFFDLEFIKEI